MFGRLLESPLSIRIFDHNLSVAAVRGRICLKMWTARRITMLVKRTPEGAATPISKLEFPKQDPYSEMALGTKELE